MKLRKLIRRVLNTRNISYKQYIKGYSDIFVFINIVGDLNYRKLLGDREWPCETTDFNSALRYFNPAPMLALRTLKSDLAVGLEPGTVQRLDKENKDWFNRGKGEHGFMQFTDTRLPVEFAPPELKSNPKKVIINENLNCYNKSK